MLRRTGRIVSAVVMVICGVLAVYATLASSAVSGAGVDWGETGFAAGMSWWVLEHVGLYLWLAAVAGALCFVHFLGRTAVPARVCAVTLADGSTYWHDIDWSLVALPVITDLPASVPAVLVAATWLHGRGNAEV